MWLTVKEYSNKTNLSLNVVYQKLHANKLQFRKNKGITEVFLPDDQQPDQPETNIEQQTPATTVDNQPGADEVLSEDAKYNLAVRKRTELENALKLEKLKNLQQDTLIKKQKQVFTKELYRQEYATGVYECFSTAFSSLKNVIIDLKLNKENAAKFKRVYAECLKKFEQELKKYLATKDKEEMQNEENRE